MCQFPPGTLVDGHYEVVAHVGEGGMGVVLKVRELALDRILALKVLHPEWLSDSDSQQRFIREGKILATLKHPNILTFYKLGVSTEFAYIATEFVEGEPLSVVLAREGKLTAERVVSIGIQICQAMAYAHEHGVIHRDLKPGNVMLLSRSVDIVKIVDFGLAKLVRPTDEVQKLTSTGTLIGSIYYMSPEQCMGKIADARSDIYALGCLLYEAIVGEPPLVAENSVAQMHLAVNVTPAPLAKRVSEALPIGLNEVLMKAMRKEPEARFSSMIDFGNELRVVQSGGGSTVLESGSQVLSTPIANGKAAASPASWLLFCGVLSLLALAASVCFWRSGTATWHSEQVASNALSPLGVSGLIAQGEAFEKQRKFEQARRAYQKALEMVGDRSPSTKMKILKLLALSCSFEGKDDLAEPLFRQSLAIARRTQKSDSIEVADLACALALSCSHQQKYKEAEALYEEALALSERALGQNNPEHMKRILGAANNYSKQAKHEQAVVLLEKAIAICETIYEPGSGSIGMGLTMLPAVYGAAGKIRRAELILMRWHRKLSRDSRDQLSLLFVCHALCVVLENQGKFRESEPYAQEAVRLTERSHDRISMSIAAECARRLGDAQYENRKFAQAEASFRKSVDILKAKLLPNDVIVAESMSRVLKTLIAQRKLKEACVLYKEEASLREPCADKAIDRKLNSLVQQLSDELIKDGRLEESKLLRR